MGSKKTAIILMKMIPTRMDDTRRIVNAPNVKTVYNNQIGMYTTSTKLIYIRYKIYKILILYIESSSASFLCI